MGIAIDFLIKHVRPIDDGVDLLCGNDMRNGLRQLGVGERDIDVLFLQWATTAKLKPVAENDADFAQTAWTISRARWDELYPTSKSTICFLNAPLLKELSYASERNAGQAFTFDPAEAIPVAVTIEKNSQRYSIVRGASGFEAAANAQGLCVHFEKLIA
ncbi:hypothetical protein ACPPVT_03435 [Angustibacter sp. McL0619]|uniref:hypothetical protein n=1 Tax=Angustibacter sp. McL0619 TaxID=3415676 RepID=UPI003CF694C5